MGRHARLADESFLPDMTPNEIRQKYLEEMDVRNGRKMLLAYHYKSGKTLREAAEITCMEYETARRWIAAMRKKGSAAIPYRKAPGAPRRYLAIYERSRVQRPMMGVCATVSAARSGLRHPTTRTFARYLCKHANASAVFLRAALQKKRWQGGRALSVLVADVFADAGQRIEDLFRIHVGRLHLANEPGYLRTGKPADWWHDGPLCPPP